MNRPPLMPLWLYMYMFNNVDKLYKPGYVVEDDKDLTWSDCAWRGKMIIAGFTILYGSIYLAFLGILMICGDLFLEWVGGLLKSLYHFLIA